MEYENKTCPNTKELVTELNREKTDVAIISEMKKKLQGTKKLRNYLMIYSGVSKNKCASPRTAILISKK